MRPTPDPTVRSWLIDRLGPLGVGAVELAGRLGVEADPGVRRALVLAMGQADPARLAGVDRRAIAGRLLDAYRTDPDPGLHSAAGWLLRLWKLDDDLRRVDAELAGQPRGNKGWFVNTEGQTFVVVRAPDDPAPVAPGDGKPTGRIGRSFAISTTEVTVAQFRRFFKDLSEILDLGGDPLYIEAVSPTEDCPVNAVHWYFAAMYCRWLSEKESEAIAPDQCCYPGIEQIAAGWDGGELAMIPGHLDRKGYRLPTADEWKYACRSGTSTPRPYGAGEALLPRYSWFQGNSGGRTRPVGSRKPNDFGLFDMLGNLREWCDDGPAGSGDTPDSPVRGDRIRNRFGGSYRDAPDLQLSELADAFLASSRNLVSGFRIVRTLD